MMNALEASEEGNGEQPSDGGRPACVLTFNANDPSGAGGLAADITAMASVGAHALPVATGAYLRDSAEILGHVALGEESVTEQARAVLEDIEVQLVKVGFAGSLENLGAIAALLSDYPHLPVIAYMPNLAWWEESRIEPYQDAFRELLLEQTTVLVGNHSTLWRWLLPDWSSERPPSARDIAKAAGEHGVSFTLVSGIVLPGQQVDNVLSSPQAVLGSEKFELFDGVFAGAGDTLSGALAALLASGSDLVTAASEALHYLDRSLGGGFSPGMGAILPDRLFWAQPEAEGGEEQAAPADSRAPTDTMAPPHGTKH